jgi:hypothetical protein
VLYQLSYAPRLRRGLYPRSPGITRGVSEAGNDNPETSRQAEDDLLQQQDGQVDDEKEGERDDAVEAEDEQ